MWGGNWGVDGGWMPLPTRPQQFCHPAPLVFLLPNGDKARCTGSVAYVIRKWKKTKERRRSKKKRKKRKKMLNEEKLMPLGKAN